MKTCFKCGEAKELDQFYLHKRMADGHLNKCKECTKMDSALRIERKKRDPLWLVQEARRCREKIKKNRSVCDPISVLEAKKRWAENNKNKVASQRILQNAVKSGRIERRPCRACGATEVEAHHEDYSKPLDVVWLCDKHHKERHVQIRDCIRLGIPIVPF